MKILINEQQLKRIVTTILEQEDSAEETEFSKNLAAAREKDKRKEEKRLEDKYGKEYSDDDFFKLNHSEKALYIDVNAKKKIKLTLPQFKSLMFRGDKELMYKYIESGIGLTDEQFNLIKDDRDFVKRYAQIANEKYLKYLGDKNALRDFTKSQLMLIRDFPEDIEIYEGDLNLAGTQIKSLNKLRIVTGSLNLIGTGIKTLGNLERVGEFIMRFGSNISPKTLYYMRELGSYKALYIDKGTVSLGNLKSVDGNLEGARTSLKSLGNVEYIGGNCNLQDSAIGSLGKLKGVGGYVDIRNTPLSTQYSKEQLERKYPGIAFKI